MSMARKTLKSIPQDRTPLPEVDPEIRVKSFREVAEGYTRDQALHEAERCLGCSKPGCVTGCPVSINIPGFIRRIQEKNFKGAYEILTRSTTLPAVCGRVCRQEDQCEGSCTVGRKLAPVAIGNLERWLGDLAIREGWHLERTSGRTGRQVAVIGSGPAGLACAADMVRAGCEVTVFEALHEPGGVLKYGIPEFRLPNDVVDAEVENLKRLGVRFECDALIGRLLTIDELKKDMGFDAIFIGTGAGYPSFMGIPGESLNGVLSANEFLTRCNLMKACNFPCTDTPVHTGRRVAVIGAGNTAMDALRVATRLGAEKTYCLYRRSRSESPARLEELRHAEEEGVEFRWLTLPLEILNDGQGSVRGLSCVRTELGEPDVSGRRKASTVPGTEHVIDVDMVIYALGTNANPIIGQTTSLKLNARGYIATNERLETSMPGVFAGGDIVTGAATVISAMGAGRRAAGAMKSLFGFRFN